MHGTRTLAIKFASFVEIHVDDGDVGGSVDSRADVSSTLCDNVFSVTFGSQSCEPIWRFDSQLA